VAPVFLGALAAAALLHYPADHVLAVTTLATPAGLGEVQSQRPAA
jgi:hypothetical protein